MGHLYSEKANYGKDMFSSVTCSLHSTGCNSYFEICLIKQVYFFVMITLKKIGIFHLDAVHCKFTLAQYIIIEGLK